MSRYSLTSTILALLTCSACDGEIHVDEPADGPHNSPDLALESDLGAGGPGQYDAGSHAGDMQGDMKAAPEEELAGNALSPQQEELFTCSTGAVIPSAARQRLIDRGEWKRNVGRDTNEAGLSPFDPLQNHPYSTFVEGETMNTEVLDVYMNMSSVAASAWQGPSSWMRADGREESLRWSSPFKANPMLVENIGKIACLIDERKPAPDDACLESFVSILLEKAVLHRPAKAEELSALVAYARKALAREDQPVSRAQRRDTVRTIVQAAWMTTGALFTSEGFDQAPNAQGVSAMSDWEIAHALSYLLGQMDPGAVSEGGAAIGAFPLIVEAATNGSISNPETITSLIGTYATRDDGSAAARSTYLASYGIQQFFREWLGYMDYTAQTKDSPHATTAYGKDVIATTYSFAVNGPRHSGSSKEPRLFSQLDDLIARILHEDTDVFRQLLTTRDYYVAADVGSDGGSPHLLYNLGASTTATQAGRWVTVPRDQRAGVLTHPAWLASHSLNFENDPNPVHRGKWIRESLLCGEVPPTPITVEAALDPETRDQSTRTRVKLKTEQGGCLGCHNLMNPLGYPFEIYNHIGILRAEDHGAPPDGSSVLILMPDERLNGPVRDAVELSEKLADSQFVKRCFIRQSFRYFMGREETMQDACILSQMEQTYDERGSFKAMLSVLLTSPAFLERQHPVSTP